MSRAEEVYAGGCHCGAVLFEVRGAPARATDCNCSIRAKKGFLHWIVEKDRFRLLTPEGALSEYRFGTGAARRLFCKTCGVASFYIPRSHPDGVDVNLRCVEGVDLAKVPIEPFDGRNWDKSIGTLRA